MSYGTTKCKGNTHLKREGLPTREAFSLNFLHLALRYTILQVYPLDWMDSAVGAHRFSESREEGMFAEALEEPEAFQLVHDGILHLSKTQFDAGGVQCLVELAD